MTDHISIIAPPLQSANPATLPSDTVAADGWFPSVSQATLRTTLAIDTSITAPRLRAAICAAMETALLDLRDWQDVQIQANHTSLAVVPSSTIDGQSRLVLLWHRAIGALTKAEIVETSRDYDATGAGERSLSALDEAIIQNRRDATHAIRDLIGRTRITAELI